MTANSDLFLLMFNLSLINDIDQIKRIYLESMNYSYDQLKFSIVSSNSEDHEGVLIPIVKGDSDFGTLLVEGDMNSYNSVQQSYIRNSVGLLSVILQNRTFAQELTNEKITLQENVKDREFFIDNIVNVAPVLIYIIDLRSGKNIYTNKSLTDFLGYRKEDLDRMGEGFLEKIIYPDDIVSVQEHHKSLISADLGEVMEIEYGIKNKKGNWLWLLSRDTPFRKDQSGKTIEVLGCSLDITFQKEHDLQIRKSLKEIRRLKNTLSNVIDSMPSILIAIDEHYQISHWNTPAEMFFNIPAEEAVGKQFIQVVPFLDNQKGYIYKVINEKNIMKNQELFKKNNGEVHHLETTIFPLLDSGDSGAVIRIDDITEKIRMEEMMVQNEKMMSVGGLAAGMAHEINNPLAGIIQTNSVLENRLLKHLDNPSGLKAAGEAGTTIESIKSFMEKRDIPRMLNTISESGKRISDIIDNMLSFSRSDNSEKAAIDLEKLIDKTIELAATDYNLKKHYDFKNISIVKEYEKNLPMVVCEKVKIQQVLLNLFQNGGQAMGKVSDRSSQFIVRLYKDTGNEKVVIEVEDNGPGMKESIQKRVFEPFLQQNLLEKAQVWA